MATVSVEVPDEVVCHSEQSPEEFAQAMRLAAMFWYQREEMSMARAAKLAGMHRAEFMMALADAKIDTVAVDIDDLRRELARG